MKPSGQSLHPFCWLDLVFTDEGLERTKIPKGQTCFFTPGQAVLGEFLVGTEIQGEKGGYS